MPRAYQGAKTRTHQKLYGYKNLITWQKADDLAAMVHELTLHWGPGVLSPLGSDAERGSVGQIQHRRRILPCIAGRLHSFLCHRSRFSRRAGQPDSRL